MKRFIPLVLILSIFSCEQPSGNESCETLDSVPAVDSTICCQDTVAIDTTVVDSIEV